MKSRTNKSYLLLITIAILAAFTCYHKANAGSYTVTTVSITDPAYYQNSDNQIQSQFLKDTVFIRSHSVCEESINTAIRGKATSRSGSTIYHLANNTEWESYYLVYDGLLALYQADNHHYIYYKADNMPAATIYRAENGLCKLKEGTQEVFVYRR